MVERLVKGYTVLIDSFDAPIFDQYPWHVRKEVKGRLSVVHAKQPISQLSRLLTNAPRHVFVDHANRNTLDNRRDNLRFCTTNQNQHNRIGWRKRIQSSYGPVYKGVWRISRWKTRKSARHWEARICVNGKQSYLGVFRTNEEAAIAYDDAARKVHGRFARLNFPKKGEMGINDEQ